jgi:L-seryl-tRNA(Ser) seleniumtransferase
MATSAVRAAIEAHGHELVLEAVRTVLQRLRLELGSGVLSVPDEKDIVAKVNRELDRVTTPNLKPVFNLTGTIVHTNLGRAPLPEEAIEAICRVARQPSNLEYDLVLGKRGDRDSHVEEWICRLSGAEAATVVNNNAAAVMLVLNTLAARKEVPVSRGELIEIGGSFRLPAIMSRAGVKLREVGTTNRTHAKDFEEAISAKTGLVLKVHTSNYEVQGFTAAVAESKLAAIAHKHNLPFVVDLGAGALVDLAQFGLPHEQTVGETLKSGADLVTFSGDKLLGGPQAGLIAGSADLIKALKKNPMKRAMRCDKLTLAALEAVLRLHANPSMLVRQSPMLRQLARARDDIERLAKELQPRFAERLAGYATVRVAHTTSQIGSGARPIDRLQSAALVVTPVGQRREAAHRLNVILRALRDLPIPILGRVASGALWLDMRTLEETEGFCRQLNSLVLNEEDGGGQS